MSDEKNTFTISRTFDVPPEKIWQALTDPEIIKKWWGPRNVSIPECEIDLRVGGKIHIVMEGGEEMGDYKGMRWPLLGEFTVVEPSTKLAYNAKGWTEGQEDESTIDQTTELLLTEEEGRTKLEITATIHQAGPGTGGMALQGMQYGMNESLDKLEELLADEKEI